jgi:Cof subfamily protein (haloacid dehalogenase superfamily)
MTYRLLALDLDGTLLNRDGHVSPRDRAAIDALRARGGLVTIVTGRLAAGSIDAARACAIDGAIGCCDGSHLYDVAADATIVHHELSEGTRLLLDDVVADAGLARFAFSTAQIFYSGDGDGERYAGYVKTWSPLLRALEHVRADAAVWRAHAPLAQLIIGDDARVSQAFAAIQAAPSAAELRAVQFAVSAVPGAQAILVRAHGTSKGTALTELCARYGVALEDSVAVGDWWNDVPMFEVAGRSFAMPSAPPDVKAAATDLLDGDTASIADVIAACWA